MNFWQKTKRFLEPMTQAKKVVFLQFFIHAVYSFGTLIPMILLITLRQEGFVLDQLFVYGIVGYLILGMLITRLLREYYWAIPGYTYAGLLTKKYIKSITLTNNLAYEAFWTGRILSIFEKWINTWSSELAEMMVFTVKFSLIGCFILWRMYSAGGLYLLILCVLIISLLSWIIRNNKKALHWKMVLKEEETIHTRRLVKIFMSKFEILQNKRYADEISSLESDISKQYHFAERRNKYLSLMYDVPYFWFLAIIISLYFLQYFNYFPITWGQLLELVWISLLAQALLLPFVDFIKDFSKQFVHVEKLWDVVDTTERITGYDTGKKFEFKKWDYELWDIKFAYHSQASVLENFSVKISGSKKTALVGRSWGGKTTIMKLLAGYMRPTGWKLMIDGQDITDIRLDSYYPHIGYLTQEPSVFDGTIEENLLYGARGKVSKEQLKRAIELSECQFIYELEDGIKTEIGERGVRLSWGQKQRLAIAKIFLKDPEIILLDEPTAALDSYSEEKVARAFEHLFVGRTVVVIAHRLQTVKSADDIIVIEKWKIVERWTHTQLLKLWKKYAGMVDLQSGIVHEDDGE